MPKEGFGAQELDSESAQSYLHARNLTGRTGRFSEVDSVFNALFEPQAWNRYAYALNNPVALTDFDGQDAKATDEDAGVPTCADILKINPHDSPCTGTGVYSGQGQALRDLVGYILDHISGSAGEAASGLGPAARNRGASGDHADRSSGLTTSIEISVESGPECTVDNGCMKLGMMPLTPGGIGAAGEQIVKIGATIGDKARILINGRVRIPDGVLPGMISEVKNVGYQAFTQQLRDYAAWAAAQNSPTTFTLWVRSTTRLSGPLKAAYRAGVLDIKPFIWP